MCRINTCRLIESLCSDERARYTGLAAAARSRKLVDITNVRHVRCCDKQPRNRRDKTCKHGRSKKKLTKVGFEPTPPKRPDP